MDNRPVGIYDSGQGGLTALRAFRRLLPEENVIYFADTARCPYGNREVSELRAITKEILDYFKERNAKATLAACGTLSVNAYDIIDCYEIKSFNVLQPAVSALVKAGNGGAIAVIATNASVKSGVYKKTIAEKCNREVYEIACQDFVTLCETGHTDKNDPELKKSVESYLCGIKGKVDTLLLGCTHFGLIEEAISEYLPGVEIVSAASASARALADYLIDNNLTGGEGTEEIICSGYNVC